MAEPRRSTTVRARPAGAAAPRPVPGQRRHPADALRTLIDRLDVVHRDLTLSPASHAGAAACGDEIEAVAAELRALIRGQVPAGRPPLRVSEDGLRAWW